MTKKIIYTATLGQASSDFFLLEEDSGKGVYVGTKVKASKEMLDLYHKELKSKHIELPERDGFVTILRPPRYGDVMNGNSKITPKCLLGVIYDHCDKVHWRGDVKIKEVDLYYVGKDYAGLLHKVRPLLNSWDRQTIRQSIADYLRENCSHLYHYFNGYEVDYIHNVSRGK